MTEVRPAAGPAGTTPWRLAVLVLLLVGFILYGSLYPFRWRPLPPGTDLGALLLQNLLQSPGGRGDVLANLVLYAPLGFLLGAMLPPRWPRVTRVLLPALAGAVLSAVVETLQLWLGGRVSSGADLALNTLGALAGAALAAAMGGAALFGAQRRRLNDPVAALLVLAWLGWRFYPYVPSIDLQAWKDNLKPLLLHPQAEPLRTLQLLASWTGAALLAEAAAGAALARWLVPLGLAGALAAEVLIPGKALTLAEALAIGLALPAWSLLRGRPWAAPVMAAALLGAMLAERLAPFDFAAVPRPFGWVPFRSLVAGSLGAGVQAILAKLFLQGALLWWLLRCGLRLPLAATLQAAAVLAASVAQCWLPGRSAEITDTLLVLGLALAFRLMRPQERPDATAPSGWRARVAGDRTA